MKNKLNGIQNYMKNNGIYEVQMLDKFEDNSIKFIEGIDLSTAYSFEITFKKVAYIHCLMSLYEPEFRLATEEEDNEIRKNYGAYPGKTVFIFDVDKDTEYYNKYFVIAEDLDYKTELVFR